MQNEPSGWRLLQERAKREKDPKKLAAIIDQMNQLLTEHEKAANGEGEPASEDPGELPKR